MTDYHEQSTSTPITDAPRNKTSGRPKGSIQPGSIVDLVSQLNVGDETWIVRTNKQPIPHTSRRPDFMKDWRFEVAAFFAVPQTFYDAEPVRLWRIKRVG